MHLMPLTVLLLLASWVFGLLGVIWYTSRSARDIIDLDVYLTLQIWPMLRISRGRYFRYGLIPGLIVEGKIR